MLAVGDAKKAKNKAKKAAKKVQEEAVAVKFSRGSNIIVPGTPRHTGIGAGARVSQASRRRGGT